MRRLILSACLAGIGLAATAQVDDVAACLAALEKERHELSQKLASGENATILKTMLDRGMWEQACAAISTGTDLDADDRSMLSAYFHILNNDYLLAERKIAETLGRNPDHPEANRLHARLLIEAWRLDEAVAHCRAWHAKHPGDLETCLLLGRALLLLRKYDEASALVARLHRQFPERGGVYRLEADVHFWNLRPAEAEPLLIRALELEPFDADARFSYGYAIWRKIDATQLDRMAGQWEIALALNPLHFPTHWHWGNGHTNRTFVDYADPDEDTIRDRLSVADSLFTRNSIEQAVALTHEVEKAFPRSVLPQMHRASLWYGDFDSPRRSERLDSALVLFREILKRKPHYGPAHNGLSAVIKSKRIPYLSTYDSIAAVLRQTRIDDPVAFETLFPDVGYYPGVMAKAMVYNQLNTAVAYFPFLVRQKETFVIPPLHKDLAIVMNRSYFRYATTFDNRQWMDIRGVGSGAAAIEYVERGAWQERNVILHEYVHLFHDAVLTDGQNRRIRALYYSAMANGRTLDYYSQNNEHEYLAQTYPAFFEPEKVHPLDFKSMNTTSALKEKDPGMYAFLDSLTSSERRYLAGDRQAMASNWAQVYVNLSRQARGDTALAARLLDTALVRDDRYQPAWLAYAALHLRRNDADAALRCIRASERIDAGYAPTFRAYAEWVAATETDPAQSLRRQVEWMRKALALENDLQTRAGMAMYLRQVYADHAAAAEAVAEADEYVRSGSEISTYLRDRKDDARMFAACGKAMQGDRGQLAVIDSLVRQKPQNYAFALNAADALAACGEYARAIALMRRVQMIFLSNRARRADFDLRTAECHHAAGRPDSARVYYAHGKAAVAQLTPGDAQRLYRLSLELATGDEIPSVETVYPGHSPVYAASCRFTRGLQKEKAGDGAAAARLYGEALLLDPYLLQAKAALRRLSER
ncbi:MAG: tetratricopeptide repeat protein [Tannerella sp.]|jgi:predicted Zn-dependent protease|nr:tetratricopeptide repeat protein [Tannerella sp.]